ncbi:MAG: cytochrome c-type biogenesis protein CcmH [Dehalococcoidales bacterium]|nr:cytochrome c-type biogenesis protein CcmH [Dehalococcoidales bacterium]
MKLRVLAILVFSVLAFIAPVTSAYALTSKDIERELMCQCGCTMVVDVCDCETANQIRTKITEMMGQGQSKDQIVGYFVKQYGEKMLSSPPKKGFNLVAWIVPFAAVAAGGTGLFFVLRAWARKGRGEAGQVTLVQPLTLQETDEYRGRLEDELRRFKEEGSA